LLDISCAQSFVFAISTQQSAGGEPWIGRAPESWVKARSISIRILTHISGESEAAAKLVSHQLLKILRKCAGSLGRDSQILVFFLPQPTENICGARTEAWSVRAVGAGAMQ